MNSTAAVVILLVSVLTACDSTRVADESGTVEGVVIAVDGTLAEVSSFTLRLADGTDATFFPQAGILFDDSAPLDHVREHLVSGHPVQVEYITLNDGTLSASAVGDG